MKMSIGRLGRQLAGLVVAGMALVAAGPASAEMGQPAPWEHTLQEAATPVMENIIWFHNFLLVLITVITLFVLALLVIVVVKFNARANPVPSKTTHNTLIEVAWTLIPVLILVIELVRLAEAVEKKQQQLAVKQPGATEKRPLANVIMSYLESKNPADFTGLETYCYTLQQQGKISWFPIKKAVVVEGRNKQKKDIPGLYSRLGSMETRAVEQSREMRKMREEQDDQRDAIKELRDDVTHMRKTTDEIHDLLVRLDPSRALGEGSGSGRLEMPGTPAAPGLQGGRSFGTSLRRPSVHM